MEDRRHRLGIICAALLTAILFATVATSGGVGLWGPPQWDPTLGDLEPIELDGPINDSAPLEQPQDDDTEPWEVPGWVTAVLQVVATVVAATAAVAVAVYAWRNRPRLRWRRRAPHAADFEVLPDVAAAVVEQAAAQRALLLDGAPRNAIVQCWLRLERDVASAGMLRDPADTPLEFTARVLRRYAVDPGAINELAALYREARFSDHSLDEAHRLAAGDALDRLHRTLAASLLDDDTDDRVGATP